MELLKEYLLDEALVVIPVLLILGAFIKNTPRLYDWIIPYVLLVIGVAFTVALIGFNVDAVIQGVLVAGAAVFGNELFKQAKERDDE